MIWLFDPPPPLHNQIRAIIWSAASLSPSLHPCPPPPFSRAYNTEARRWFSRLASNSEVVSMTADIGQQIKRFKLKITLVKLSVNIQKVLIWFYSLSKKYSSRRTISLRSSYDSGKNTFYYCFPIL
jgi:hypothetical protein